ncbi:Transaldolase [Candidatus Entotheonellaceae bacterium PAL068K]
MKSLLDLITHGQSYWLDNLTRAMIQDGSLQERVETQGLRGVTSNPAIFNKAISGSDAYDGQVVQLVQEERSVEEIYEQLVVTDVRNACDILRSVYDDSDGVDGYVSLEVSPYLAHHTEATMQEARRLFSAVDRPNVFIKIPGTPAGVPAIEEMLYEGINVNVTLLFSLPHYEAVAQAYVRAMQRRLAEAKPVKHVASVASFFLSRIDVLVDQLLGHRMQPGMIQSHGPRPEQLLGQAALASAKLAYQSFKTIFSGPGWQTLAVGEARVQRPLWASTSTKDPLYSDVCYVEPLIGPDTVNTMPDETIEAFADHGTLRANSVEAEVEAARQALNDLECVGIDINVAAQQLLNEGVQKFIEPFDVLIRTLANKRQAILAERSHRQTVAFGPLKSAAASVYTALDSRQTARRLWQHDPRLWKSDAEQMQAIRQRLGWLDSVATFRRQVDEITAFAAKVKQAAYTHVVLLGMGGSSLCAEVCRETFGVAPGWPELITLDNTDPAAVRQVEERLDLGHALFIVASKSGTTTETLSFYRYFYARLRQVVGEKAGKHFVAITDPASDLVEEARGRGFWRYFENPEDIGGRYSALSYFGLLPMALLGIDIDTLLARAQRLALSSGPSLPADTNVGLHLGTLLGVAAQHGRDKVTFVLSEATAAFGYWVEQLLAESTGKEGKGLVPVEGEPLGPPQEYGEDRVFVSMRTADRTETQTETSLTALENAGHPVVRIVIHDALDLGAEFLRWELATATAGVIMGLNPFNEPNVAESKQNTSELLSEWQQHGSFSQAQPVMQADGIAIYGDTTQPWMPQDHRDSLGAFLGAFVDLAAAPDYLGLLAYFLRTPARHEALQALRSAWRDRRGVATTLGYGPRYLHSTGQLHKGGPNRGVFLLFTADAASDLWIPQQPYGFTTLQRAQALGDLRSLNSKGRRIMRVHLGHDIEAGLRRLADVAASYSVS